MKYTDKALKDISFWKKIGDKAIQTKISKLLLSIEESPFEGIGKPEALKYELAGFWSRRINREHRIIYKVQNEIIEIHSLKDHYL